MSLGVLNNLSAMSAANNLNNTQNALSKTLQQLSSGSKINSGADDAAGLSLVNGLQANATALAQSQTNATEGVNMLTVADGALSQVTNLLNRAVTLATEVSNGTLNGSQNAAANQEYQSILSEINNIGATTTYNQKTVFGSSTGIYTGDSSSQGASINQLNIRGLSSASVGDTGGVMSYSSGQTEANVFINLSNNGQLAATSDSLGTASQTTSMQVSYLQQGAAGAPSMQTQTITVGQGTQYANTVGDMINAINNSGLGLTASLGTAQQAGTAAVAAALSSNQGGGTALDTGIMISGVGVGTGTNAVGEIGKLTVAAVNGDTLGGSLSIVGADGQTHNIALGTAGSTDTLTNLAATINNAGYGLTAKVNTAADANGNGAGTVLTFTTANSAVSVNGTGVTSTVAATGPNTVTFAPDTTSSATVLGSFELNNGADTVVAGLGTLAGTDAAGAALVPSGATLAALETALNKTNGGVAKNYFNFSVSGNTLTVSKGTDWNSSVTLSGNITMSTSAVAAKSVSLADVPTPGSGFSSTVGTVSATSGLYGAAVSGSMTIGGKALAITSADNTLATLASTINAGDYGVTASYDQTKAQIVFTSANSALRVDTTSLTIAGGTTITGNDTATAQGASQSSPYYSVGIASSGGIVDHSTVSKDASNNVTYGGTGIYSAVSANQVVSNVGMVSDLSGNSGVATISYADQAGQSLSKSSLTNSTNAQAALTALNAAITDVAAQDGYLGAQINTLNAVSSVLSTQQQNVIAAQNAVQATDYATAASNMSKYQILSQTGISALAQANSMQQEVLKLLQ
ncbi:MAG TPA: flagellin [Terracidiphilus sp.]|nr:flagellin [Terracidiphilus sp.]